ncbi:MAG: hypothetical protein ACQEW0_09110 [Pseudomonadota bacterium]
MTNLSDSPAIERANDLLADPTASSDDLLATRGEISAQMREQQAIPRPEPAMTTSIAEHKRVVQELEDRDVLDGVLHRLYGRLSSAIQSAQAREAINGAAQAEKDLAKSLDTLEAAQRKADAARAEVMAQVEGIQRDRAVAGSHGKGKVGASPELVERIIAAGAYDDRMGGRTSINSLRRKVQIDDGKPAVETRYVDHGANAAGELKVSHQRV